MYADVALKEPVETLTYRVPTNLYLSVVKGSLVEVVFRGKKSLGVVIGLKKHLKPSLKDKKILSLDGLVCSNWIRDKEINLARQIAQFSQAPIGIVIFRLMPIVQKRSIVPMIGSSNESFNIKAKRYHLVADLGERIRQYLRIIKRMQSTNNQAMIVVSQGVVARISTILKEQGINFKTADSLTKNAKTIAAYREFQSGGIQVLLGTRKIIGWPGHNLRLIIVDDPIHLAHSDDREPYLDSATIALFRKKFGINVVLGFPVYTPELFSSELNNSANKIKIDEPQAQLEIVELKQGLVSSRLREIILTKEQVFIIAPRKGLGGIMRCLDCDNSVRCPKCQTTVFFGEDEGVCGECQQQVFASSCRVCGGHALQSLGIGSEQMLKELKKEFGEISGQITIITEGEVDQIPDNTTIIFSFADSPLSSPHLLRPYRFLGLIKDLSSRGQVIVQTKNTSSSWWQVLGGNKKTMQDLLMERKKYNLSPFTKVYSLLNPSKKIIDVIGKAGYEIELQNDILKVSIPKGENLDLSDFRNLRVKSPSLI